MDVDPSDFLSTPSRSRRSGSGGVAFIRTGWVFLLPLVALIPLGFSLLRSHVTSSTPPISFSQKLQADEQTSPPAPVAPPSSEPAPKPGADSVALNTPEGTPPSNLTTDAASATGDAKVVSNPKPAIPTTPAPSGFVYRVRPGDTLSQIALRYGIPSMEIVTANGLRGQDTIFAGQVLTLPNVTEEKARAVAAAAAKTKGALPSKSSAGVAQTGTGGKIPLPDRSQIVLGPPAPNPFLSKPMPTAGLPAPVSPAKPEPRRIVLGPPVPREKLPMDSKKAPSYPNASDYLPLTDSQPQSFVTTASLELAPSDGKDIGPSQTALSQPVSRAGLISYVVQPFDTLASIAKAHATTPETILDLNRVTSLREGQTILLPISHNRLPTPASNR